jgi:hypothetical protein
VRANKSFTSARCGLLALIAVLSTLMLPAAAQAVQPVLVSVGQNNGRITATWTIPKGMAMDYIEAGTSAAVTPQGDFPLANTAVAESLNDFQTTYESKHQIGAGTYFVHASAFDTTKCKTGDEPNCVDEWSNMLTVTVPPGVDKSTGFTLLAASSPQRIGKLFVQAQMGERGTITATGTVKVPNSAKVYRFTTASAKVFPGLTVKLRLRLPKKALTVVRRALKRKKLKAKVIVTAKDDSGNTRSQKGTIRLKR